MTTTASSASSRSSNMSEEEGDLGTRVVSRIGEGLIRIEGSLDG